MTAGECRADYQPFTGLDLYVRDDDDKVFNGIGEGAVAFDGRRIFIRASEWPAIKAELQNLPRPQ